MLENSKKPGKLGLAILNDIVTSRFGEEFVKEHHIPADVQISIAEAMHNTADRLWKDWADKRAWEALFNTLPRNRNLLDDLKPAVESFYLHPTDIDFAVVLTEIMHDHNQLSPEAVQKAVGEYITTLTEELITADKNFCENARSSSELRLAESPGLPKTVSASKQPPTAQQVHDATSPRQGDEDEMRVIQESSTSREAHEIITVRQLDEKELKAALNCLSKLPEVKIPRLAALPKDSRFPILRPDSPFVGRKEELRQMSLWLKKGETVVINQAADDAGEGGIGKTQLAYAFAQRYGRFFAGGVFWLNFAEPDLIPGEVAVCGGLADGTPLGIRVKQVLSDWQSEIPRLLIFDDCEDPQLVIRWRPSTGGSRVLVTSRQTDWDPSLGFKILPVRPFKKSESITLLRSFWEKPEASDSELDAIAGNLENLPLAVHIAGRYQHTYRSEISPKQFLEALRNPGPLSQLLRNGDELFPSSYDIAVGRAVAVSLDRLRHDETNRLAIDLMKQIACFAPGEFIPLEILRTSAGINKTPKATFDKWLNLLNETGLVEGNIAGDLRMHRLVSRFLRDFLPDRRALTQVELAILSAAAKVNQSGNFTNMQPLLAHLKYLTDQALERRREQSARLANELGYYLETIADYPGARSYYELALAHNQRVLGEAHPDTTTSLNNLGGLLERIGDLAGARPYYEKALVIRRKVLGMEHLDTARSLNNMGHLLQAMENYADARPYFSQALAIRRRVLGEENSATVTSFNNMGGLLQTMGDYTGARQYYEQALAINQKLLGEEHIATAGSLTNLGGVLLAMGDQPGARLYYEKALEINQKVLGKEHPGTASSLTKIGEVLQAMGDNAGARSYFERALSIRMKELGEEAPDTASSLNNLGEVLQGMGDFAAARRLFEHALTIRKKVLGEGHPETAISLNNMGVLLLKMGDSTGAKLYLEQAQAINQKVQEENQRKKATGFNFRAYSVRAKIFLAVLFFLSFGVIGWQAFSRQGVSSTALYGLVPTANETSVLHLSDFFPGLASTPVRINSQRVTATPTWTSTPSFTSTRIIPTPTFIPTSTPLPTVIGPVKSPGPTKTPVSTVAPFPTNTPIRPTPVPQGTLTPTPFFPTPVPTDTETPVPATPVPDTPVPNTPVPDTPVPNTPVP